MYNKLFCLFLVDSKEHSVYAIIIEPCSLPRRNSGYSLAHGSYHASGKILIIDKLLPKLCLKNQEIKV